MMTNNKKWETKLGQEKIDFSACFNIKYQLLKESMSADINSSHIPVFKKLMSSDYPSRNHLEGYVVINQRNLFNRLTSSEAKGIFWVIL